MGAQSARRWNNLLDTVGRPRDTDDRFEDSSVALLRTVLTGIDLGVTRVARLGRRQFLRLSAVATVSLTGVVLSACGDGDSGATTATVTTFRLSTHGERTCGACKAHGANRFYQTQSAADGDRSHPGCNCKIVKHPISVGLSNQYFRDGEVYDKRWSA